MLQRIKDLFEKGKYQSVLDELAQDKISVQLFNLEIDEQIEIRYYQSQSLVRLGKFEEALSLVTSVRQNLGIIQNKCLYLPLIIANIYPLIRLMRLDEVKPLIQKGNEVMESLGSFEQYQGTLWSALFENAKANFYYFKGDLDQALTLYQRSLAILGGSDTSPHLASVLNNIGLIYSHKGKLNLALDHFKQSLVVFEALGDTQAIARSLVNMGANYFQLGNLNVALEHFQQALVLSQKLGNLQDIAICLTNLGNIYEKKGELDKSLGYHLQALEMGEAINNQRDIAISLINIANNYELKGNNPQAIGYYRKSLELCETIGNDITTAVPLFNLILLLLEEGDISQAKDYFNRLEELQNKTENHYIDLRARLTKAMLLKHEKRIKYKVEAQIVLEKIINEEIVDFGLTAMAMINLCEFLIIEAKTYGEPEVWEEIKTIIQRLETQAREQGTSAILGDALVLKAKCAIVEGQLEEALKHFKHARTIALDRNLQYLRRKVDEEERQFNSEFKKWQELIQFNASIQERLEQAKFDEYIQVAVNASKKWVRK